MQFLKNPYYAALLSSFILFITYSVYVKVDMYNNPEEFQTPDMSHRVKVALMAGLITGGIVYVSKDSETCRKPPCDNLLTAFEKPSV